jgi:glycine C-acetyltransferase
MGTTGAGVSEAQGVMDGVDIYFGTFAKSMALIGAFISSDERVIKHLRYNSRSQIFAKSLPMPCVIGALKRLELLRTKPELKENLWRIVHALQNGLKAAGFEIGKTNSPVTPVYLNGTIPEATALIHDLRENHDIFCSMVVYPVVPKGVIMLRLIPTAVHTLDDVNYTIKAFGMVKSNLKEGKYKVDRIVEVQ